MKNNICTLIIAIWALSIPCMMLMNLHKDKIYSEWVRTETLEQYDMALYLFLVDRTERWKGLFEDINEYYSEEEVKERDAVWDEIIQYIDEYNQ